jgi:hypothetical protein
MSAEEKVRRAIALMTQARGELMCGEVDDFLRGPDVCTAPGSRIGEIRCSLQIFLRSSGIVERLDDESLEGIAKSREEEP